MPYKTDYFVRYLDVSSFMWVDGCKISTYSATKQLSQTIKAIFEFDSNTLKVTNALYGWLEPSSIDPSFYFYAMDRSTRETIMFVYKHKACNNLTWPSVFIRFVYAYCINLNMILINKTTWTKKIIVYFMIQQKCILFSNLSIAFNKYRGIHKT